MFESAILNILVFIIVFVILIEYINDKMYQTKKPTEPKKEIPEEEKILQEEPEPQTEEKPEAVIEVEPEIEEVQPEVETVLEEEPEVVEEVTPKIEPKEVIEEISEVEEVEPEVEEEKEPAEAKELPECKYPPFTHVRLVEMGLSDDEAIEFVNELIPQLEEQVPLIEAAINNADFHKIEKLTHGIKGSATNLGTGGVSDLLVEFNTYLKSEVDSDVVKA